MTDNQDSAKREAIEADYSAARIAELKLSPIVGNYDSDHLKETHRRIFQDMPRLGYDDIKPGQFRSPVGENEDWTKDRKLQTQDTRYAVAYSNMDKKSTEALDSVLKDADPKVLNSLNTRDFTNKIGDIYSKLDYIHPMSDGNSRSLREFTGQLAKDSGYNIDWGRFNKSNGGRDVLVIARDISVNKQAIPNIKNESVLRRVKTSQDMLDGNRDLNDLLKDAVKPSRAIAFKEVVEGKLDHLKAIKEFPSLAKPLKSINALALQNAPEKEVKSAISIEVSKLEKGNSASSKEITKEIPKHVTQER